MAQTQVMGELVSLKSTRSLEDKSTDFINAKDYGATITASASENTGAINAALVAAAAYKTGYVIISPGVSYTEASLVIPNDVIVIVFNSNGVVTYLVKNQGTSLPVVKGGIAIKSQGNTGVLVRSIDYGITAEPVLQVLDLTTGDSASIEPKMVEMVEIADPTAPSANRSKLYTRDNGSGKTQLVVRFPTGAIQVIATEP